jgi:glycosyltransferase involved in cell wall biosynthesis
MKITFITPTKDRPDDIRKMLEGFAPQTRPPEQIIVVDGSGEPVEKVVHAVERLKIDYLRWTDKPSAAAQRNGGLKLVMDDIELVCFFDD